MDEPRAEARSEVAEVPDLLVAEIERERRERRVLTVAAALGIVSGAVLGLVFIVAAIVEPTRNARGFFRHGAVAFVLGPPLVSMAIGYVVYVLRRRRRRR